MCHTIWTIMCGERERRISRQKVNIVLIGAQHWLRWLCEVSAFCVHPHLFVHKKSQSSAPGRMPFIHPSSSSCSSTSTSTITISSIGSLLLRICHTFTIHTLLLCSPSRFANCPQSKKKACKFFTLTQSFSCDVRETNVCVRERRTSFHLQIRQILIVKWRNGGESVQMLLIHFLLKYSSLMDAMEMKEIEDIIFVPGSCRLCGHTPLSF